MTNALNASIIRDAYLKALWDRAELFKRLADKAYEENRWQESLRYSGLYHKAYNRAAEAEELNAA